MGPRLDLSRRTDRLVRVLRPNTGSRRNAAEAAHALAVQRREPNRRRP